MQETTPTRAHKATILINGQKYQNYLSNAARHIPPAKVFSIPSGVEVYFGATLPISEARDRVTQLMLTTQISQDDCIISYEGKHDI